MGLVTLQRMYSPLFSFLNEEKEENTFFGRLSNPHFRSCLVTPQKSDSILITPDIFYSLGWLERVQLFLGCLIMFNL